MKFQNIKFIILFLLTITAFSCKKDTIQVIDTTIDLSTTARMRYFNFSANAPTFNVYANDVKVTAILSASGLESTAGLANGGVLPASGYSLLGAGSYTFKGIVSPTATTNANVTIATLTGAVENNKAYSFFSSGIYNSASKTTDAFIIEDQLPAVDNNTAYVRLVNCVSNGTAGFNLVLKNTVTLAETVIATNIAYKSGSAFVAVPIGVYELYIRYPNSSTNVISRNGTTNGTVSLTASRVYTIAAKGDMTVTSTTSAARPLLDNTANR